MFVVYPVLFSPIPEGYLVTVPDCEINTSGTDLANAMFMARDAISIWCTTTQDLGLSLPEPSSIGDIIPEKGDIVSMIDADLDEYRRSISEKAVKKTLTIPSWLNVKAEKASINFSQLLQKALKEQLGIMQ